MSVASLMSRWQSLMDIYTCSICLEPVRPNPVQCVNEHLLCWECKGGLTQCPICREPFSDKKLSRIVAGVIELLPTRVCGYNNCWTFLESNDDHEMYCGFKYTKCLICDWSGPGKLILKHVQKKHENVSFLSREVSNVKLMKFNPREKRTVYTPCALKGYFIWMVTRNIPEEQKHFKSFVMIPNGKPVDDIFVKLYFTFYNHNNFIRKIKVNPNGEEVENTIDIPWNILPSLFRNSKNLNYKVHFIIKKK